ncbi:hypothetical protein CPC16_007789 [Podila verticillata]|nr:hypothetical protein CPC16_007789 [Podila verticillata]KAI9237641.1 MAG: hypothetical protein BYD32DRAFT_415962 [Podila humilis]
MSIARWAFNIQQPLLLENIESLVTSLTYEDSDDSTSRPPTIVPVSNLLKFLPKSECEQFLEFRQEDDMRRALVGHLMVHAFFAAHHNCRWQDLVFERSADTNKPALISPEHLQGVRFNVSYHGDWVIFVGEISLENTMVRLGVDVMDFQDQQVPDSFETFTACFQDQFTIKECEFIMSHTSSGTSSPEPSSDAPSTYTASENQLRRFYRLWCLKESITKALGVGLDFDLRSIEFTIQDEEETVKPILSTVIEVHEPTSELLPEEGWSFEEALLDSDHCYAIAAQTEADASGSVLDGSEIQRLDWEQLLKDAVPAPIQIA